MKKILIFLGVLFLMSGCGDATDTLSCTSTNTANGVQTKTRYEVKYKDDDVKYVTITYDYNQDDNADATDRNEERNMDGVDADTDGLSQKNDTDNNTDLDSDDVVDGVVGDAIDGTVDGVKDTILDLAGIKSTYENQMKTYDDIDGFTYHVDVDNDDEYKVTYKIDMEKISDSDLSRFNIDRKFSGFRSDYENLGYTCE